MKKRQLNAAVVFIFALALVVEVVSLRLQKITVRLEDIKKDETVMAVRFQNWAWGHQNYLMVFNKEGRCKFLNLEETDVEEEKLLSFMDGCLADERIPYQKQTLKLQENLQEKIISIEDFNLKTTGNMCDAGSCCYYSVFGSGNQRRLVCMQEDGNRVCRSRFFEVRSICKEMHDAFGLFYRMEPQTDFSVPEHSLEAL